jgi:hypothetical protein
MLERAEIDERVSLMLAPCYVRDLYHLVYFLIKNNYLYYSKIYAHFSLDRKVYNEQILSL